MTSSLPLVSSGMSLELMVTTTILERVLETTGASVLCAPMKVDRKRLLAVWLMSSGCFSVTFSCPGENINSKFIFFYAYRLESVSGSASMSAAKPFT